MIAAGVALLATALLWPGRASRRPRPADRPLAPALAAPAWRARRARARSLDEQLPAFALATATALRAGLGLGPALQAAVNATPAPLGPVVAARLAATGSGTPLATALAAWRDDPGATDDVRLLAAALSLSAAAGGHPARAADRAAATLRERQALRGEARALATQARTSAIVLGLAPLAFAGLMTSIDPALGTTLVTTPGGWACLVVGLGLEVAGGAWMRRIVGAVA